MKTNKKPVAYKHSKRTGPAQHPFLLEIYKQIMVDWASLKPKSLSREQRRTWSCYHLCFQHDSNCFSNVNHLMLNTFLMITISNVTAKQSIIIHIWTRNIWPISHSANKILNFIITDLINLPKRLIRLRRKLCLERYPIYTFIKS